MSSFDSVNFFLGANSCDDCMAMRKENIEDVSGDEAGSALKRVSVIWIGSGYGVEGTREMLKTFKQESLMDRNKYVSWT